MKRKRCPNNLAHIWVKTRSYRERCTNCSDVFPCRFACYHQDCQDARVEADDAFDEDRARILDRPQVVSLVDFSVTPLPQPNAPVARRQRTPIKGFPVGVEPVSQPAPSGAKLRIIDWSKPEYKPKDDDEEPGEHG